MQEPQPADADERSKLTQVLLPKLKQHSHGAETAAEVRVRADCDHRNKFSDAMAPSRVLLLLLYSTLFVQLASFVSYMFYGLQIGASLHVVLFETLNLPTVLCATAGDHRSTGVVL